MFPPLLRVAPSEPSHSKVTFPIDDSVKFATVTLHVRVSLSPAIVVPGGLMEAEKTTGTVECERGEVTQ